MVGDSDRSPGATVGDVRRRRALERSRLFDQEAERYDRCRPGYPHAVIDELLGPAGRAQCPRRWLWHRDRFKADGRAGRQGARRGNSSEDG